MKACVKTGKCKLEVQEIPKPEPNGKDLIMRVTRVGLCGSDIHIWDREDRIGLVMGHEFCGTVEDNAGLAGFKAGDRIVVVPSSPTGKLADAPGIYVNGGYAEYFAAHPPFCLHVPDDVDDDEAAMIEPMAVTLKGIKDADIQIDDKVLVTGAGIIGFAAAEWARLAGAQYVAMSEINDDRIAFAKKTAPIDEVFDAKNPDMVAKMMAATGGFTKVIECTGSGKALESAISVLVKFGKIVYLGVNYAPYSFASLPFVLKQITITASFGHGIPFFEETIRHLQNKRWDPKKYITSHVGLEGVQEKFDEIHRGVGTNIKVMITP